MSIVTVDRRLYLTADGELVEHGHKDAAFLWACEGREVDAGEAKALGYKPDTEPQGDVEDEPAAVDAPEPDDTAEDEPELCGGTTASGDPCSKQAGPDGFCHFHSG